MATTPILPNPPQTGEIPITQTLLTKELIIPFAAWMDEQLDNLEGRFGGFVTASSKKQGLGR